MDFKTIFIGLVIPVLAIFLPPLFNRFSASRKAFRSAAAPILDKMLIEMSALRKGSYPFQTVHEDDIYRLYSYVNSRRRKSLVKAYEQYLEAHKIAETVHWHDENPSNGSVFFPASFVIRNPEEVLSRMNPLLKELSR